MRSAHNVSFRRRKKGNSKHDTTETRRQSISSKNNAQGETGTSGGGGDHFHQLSRHASRQAAEVEVKRNDENAKILLDKENETNVEEMEKR
jgi:hypothetical protein